MSRAITWKATFAPILAMWAALLPWAAGQPFGLSAREPNTEHYITGEPPDGPSYVFEPAFAGTPFYHPQDIVPANDGTGRVFVPGQENRIWSFVASDPPSAPQLYLQTPHPTVHADGAQEEGFLSMALHPDFAANGYFYVFYSWFEGTRSNANRHNGIWRFQAATPSAPTVNPATGVLIYEFTPTNTQHLGGGLRFGNDGYLYASYGFGMSINLSYLAGIAELDRLIGKVIRIDVDNPGPGTMWSAPASNPWVAVPGALPELYARGFRNPWKIQVDPLTGDVLLGDVGGAVNEEINIMGPGRHYGYPYREGYGCQSFLYPGCTSHPQYRNDLSYFNPMFNVLHSDPVMGTSAICLGPVYRGGKFPELFGAVLWGDFVSGHLSTMRYEGLAATAAAVLARSDLNISAIGTDHNGDIWAADWFEGQLYKLKRNVPAGGFPYHLTEAPWLMDLAKGGSAEGVLPYDVIAPLWSDGAHKTRFLAAPGTDEIVYREQNGYDFTTYTMLIKNFELETKRNDSASRKLVETRLLIKRPAGWQGYSYEWNEEETNATLLPPEGKERIWTMLDAHDQPTTQTWTYPSRSACFQCHTAVKNTILGFETLQLNRPFAFAEATDNQLRTFEHIGLFEGGLPAAPAALEALPDPADGTRTYEERARAYLHANCAMCHQPGGPTPLDFDLRWGTALAETGLLDVAPQASQGELGVPGALRIKSGDPHGSVLYLRMTAEGEVEYKMPPLAREIMDLSAARTVFAWIAGLGDGVLGADKGWQEAE
jgi:uncharacterized repeat protein (TIGR03806 family)